MTQVAKARLRAYNVGFGDCLLLTVHYTDRSQRSILIDFGSTGLPASAPPTRMADIAGDIARETGGHLDVVVATHRHADHISGFGSGKSGDLIESLDPKMIIQPWTEAPDLATNATAPTGAVSGSTALVNTMNDMHAFAAGAHFEGLRLKQDNTFPGLVADKLAFLGETNLKNAEAVARLMRMGSKGKAIYTKFGDKISDDSLLPGITINVLGPPTLKQAPGIARQASTDADEFWHLAGSWGLAAASGDADHRDLKPLFPNAVVDLPKEAEWLVPRINRGYADSMMSLLRVMDGVLNNTSVILLMQIGQTRLLFPGDAQIENWSYALFDAPDSAAIRTELAATNLYKVGHHGSLNATPKTLWKTFAHRSTSESDPERLISVVSTMAGKHGSNDSRTEVPRTTLINELKENSDFHSTQNRYSAKSPWVDIDIPIR